MFEIIQLLLAIAYVVGVVVCFKYSSRFMRGQLGNKDDTTPFPLWMQTLLFLPSAIIPGIFVLVLMLAAGIFA